MAFFTENELLSFNTQFLSEAVEGNLEKSASLTKNTIFLSFSHQDIDIATGFRNYLAKLGFKLYIDIFDGNLGSKTDRATALRIKEKIKSSAFFFLLATNNSVSSRWIPWELGIADGYKDYDNIFIVPVENSSGDFKGNEYIKIYKRIELADNKKAGIFNPNALKGVLIETIFK